MIIAKVVGLVLLIAAAVVLIWTQAGKNKPKPGAILLGRPLELMDYKTFETHTMSISEWRKLGSQHDRYPNPTSGEYTMVVPMTCVACGERIPSALRPDNYDELDGNEQTVVMKKIDREYICPKCGKNAEPRL